MYVPSVTRPPLSQSAELLLRQTRPFSAWLQTVPERKKGCTASLDADSAQLGERQAGSSRNKQCALNLGNGRLQTTKRAQTPWYYYVHDPCAAFPLISHYHDNVCPVGLRTMFQEYYRISQDKNKEKIGQKWKVMLLNSTIFYSYSIWNLLRYNNITQHNKAYNISQGKENQIAFKNVLHNTAIDFILLIYAL